MSVVRSVRRPVNGTGTGTSGETPAYIKDIIDINNQLAYSNRAITSIANTHLQILTGVR